MWPYSAHEVAVRRRHGTLALGEDCPYAPPRHGPHVGVLKAQPASIRVCMVPSAAAASTTSCVPGKTITRTSGWTLRPRRTEAA